MSRHQRQRHSGIFPTHRKLHSEYGAFVISSDHDPYTGHETGHADLRKTTRIESKRLRGIPSLLDEFPGSLTPIKR